MDVAATAAVAACRANVVVQRSAIEGSLAGESRRAAAARAERAGNRKASVAAAATDRLRNDAGRHRAERDDRSIVRDRDRAGVATGATRSADGRRRRIATVAGA